MVTRGNIGQRVKEARERAGMTQGQLAIKAGVNKKTLAQTEYRGETMPSYDFIVRVARALNMTVEELVSGGTRDQTPDELFERYRLARPHRIPVYAEIHFPPSGEPIDNVYWDSSRPAGKNIQAFRATGDCMSPKIEKGDIIVVDTDMPASEGDIVLCIENGELVAGYLRKVNSEPSIENHKRTVKLTDCGAHAVVIEVIKKLK